MTKYEYTDDGMAYTWGLAGPQGADFTLFPLKGKHTRGAVDIAKKQLRNEQDVVSINHEWVDSYNGDYFLYLRLAVLDLQGIKLTFKTGLNLDNQAKFERLPLWHQRAIIGQAFEDKILTYKIATT